MQDVARFYGKKHGIRSLFADLAGRATGREEDLLSGIAAVRKRRNYALQESISRGESYVIEHAPGLVCWVLALEDRRMIHGGLIGGDVAVTDNPRRAETVPYLVSHGFGAASAEDFVRSLPVWDEPQVNQAAQGLYEIFYQVSGWNPELLKENRLRVMQQEQINQAVAERRKGGSQALYAFEKERALLAQIRSGDRNAARQILNEMLAVIYLSSQQLAVLRARAVELMSCLTRAAIEDNPLLEPLIEQNHAWTERLVRARDFENLSQFLMDALDEFIDAIYLHGINRSNMKVRLALDFISANFTKPISLSLVAREVGLSPCRLAHLVKENTGHTVLQILQQVRVRHAQQLLTKTTKPCIEVAYEVGYGDQSYFIKHFKRISGTTPNRYRRHKLPDSHDEG
jgi:two-component system, response regulator YesN